MLAGYGLFGVGYIGMTFIVALLRGAGMSGTVVAAFYVMLGVATVVSARLWSGLLDRMRGGGARRAQRAARHRDADAGDVRASGGRVRVGRAVRRDVPVGGRIDDGLRAPQPAAGRLGEGISAFTTVFAFGQIAGPVAIGWVSDSAGLARAVYSALTLFAGAALAAGQRALRAAA